MAQSSLAFDVVKYMLIVLDSLFIIKGIMAFYLVEDLVPSYERESELNKPALASFIRAVMAIIIILYIVGLMGAIKEHPVMLKTFGSITLVMVLLG